MPYVYAFLFISVMGALYALLYYCNYKTPVPKGCEDLKTECDGCKVLSCGNNPAQNKIEGDI